MPELDEDPSAALVDAVRHPAPAGDLLLRVDAGGVLITLALLRNLARLGNQEARGGALAVIFHGERARHLAGDRAVARQRRHHEAVGERERADFEGFEKFGRRGHFLISGKWW